MNHRDNVRLAGTLYAAGALWLCWILGLTLITGEIPGPTSPYFLLSQVGFIILQTLMFFGFLGIWF